MKKNLFFTILFIPYLVFSQTKIYLDDNISITIGKEFTKQKISISEINKFIENEKLEKKFIEEKKYLEKQVSYNVTNIEDPKSFINVNINKINLSESIDNSSMDKSDEMKNFFTNYIDSQMLQNFNQLEKDNTQFVNKTKMLTINGINILLCNISTSLKVKENDVLNAKSDVIYIFNNKNMIILSIDKSEKDYFFGIKWLKKLYNQ